MVLKRGLVEVECHRIQISTCWLCACLLIIFMSSCIGDGLTNSQRKFLENLKDPIPTQKEMAYAKLLKTKKYSEINFQIPISGVVAKGQSTYIIEMNCPFIVTKDNKDSVADAATDIARELYCEVIEDSTISEFGELIVEFSNRKHYIMVKTYTYDILNRLCFQHEK